MSQVLVIAWLVYFTQVVTAAPVVTVADLSQPVTKLLQGQPVSLVHFNLYLLLLLSVLHENTSSSSSSSSSSYTHTHTHVHRQWTVNGEQWRVKTAQCMSWFFNLPIRHKTRSFFHISVLFSFHFLRFLFTFAFHMWIWCPNSFCLCTQFTFFPLAPCLLFSTVTHVTFIQYYYLLCDCF